MNDQEALEYLTIKLEQYRERMRNAPKRSVAQMSLVSKDYAHIQAVDLITSLVVALSANGRIDV